MIEGASHFANQVGAWESWVLPKEFRHPQNRFERATEEFDELGKAVADYDGSPQAKREVAEEAVDVVIRMFGFVNDMGFDVDALLAKKLGEMNHKYNPLRMREHYRNGMEYPDAMHHEKVIYNARRKKSS